MSYPVWNYYPRNVRPPEWVESFLSVIHDAAPAISTLEPRLGVTSDMVLRHLAGGLQSLGFMVETGKTAAGKIRRPVLFGDNGQAEVLYEIDAFHDGHGIVLEAEAGRGARGNAVYRDIVRTSLILDARYLALLLPIAYRHQSAGREASVPAFRDARNQFNAIYASQRLQLPFEGVLLVGY
ncbi:hypothetical protein ACH495_02995 [Micromonospora sp. NPDC018662]|uniref:hypothetical protein n=1 Tax=Micromonospora sp. NPDC018662 TaxID=3364238 RepID=UPI00379ADC19